MNGKEEEIYDILYKKKEIIDKTPKLRTEEQKSWNISVTKLVK